MRTSSSSSSYMTCSLLVSCKRALTRLFRRPARILSIKAFKFRNLRKVAEKMSPRRRRPRGTFRSVRTVFWPLVTTTTRTSTSEAEITDKMAELPMANTDREHEPFPSPETPAYVKLARVRSRKRVGEGGDIDGDEAEEACRSFESYLTEMLVDERNVKDLHDVEELLQCWERLKSPVFIELVCRFYGELCKDLFSGQDEGSVSSTV